MSRKFSALSSSNDGAAGSSSQDGYDSRFPQKESNRRHWSCSLSSSRFPLARTSGDRVDAFTKSRKVKVIDVDAEPYGSCSTQGLEVFEISDEDFQIPKKPKKADFDPFEYNSSEELEGIAASPQRKGGRENGAFDFSEDQDLWKSEKWSDAGPFSLNSSEELSDMGIPRPIKHDWKEMIMEPDVVSMKSKKKNKVNDGALEKKMKKKKKKHKKKRESRELRESVPVYIDPTATLMEIQESGETTEHVDEVNFALDGLNKGQPARARRASLISLLSICGTLQQRRRLWTYGLAKKIVDAILELDLDDKPSNLAAAALFYLLTSDGQDEHLLYSPNSICFLAKLLKPLSPAAGKDKSQLIGSKLIGLCKNAGYSQGSGCSAKGTDSISTEIMHKVREILVNCKEMKPIDDGDGDGRKQEAELNPVWVSLLTIEKACSSSISIEGFEDTPRTSRRAGANFKEKFREFGGLDAVFEVARKCHFVMEEWLEKSPSFALDSKNISGLESLVLLLKCLKIMENATFLSNNNQRHLLGMKGSFGGQQAPQSFTKLILSVIKILSGVTLLRSSLTNSQDEKMGCVSYGSSLSGGHCGTERTSYESFSQCDPCLTSGQPRLSFSRVEASQVSLQKGRFESSQKGLRSRTSCSSNGVTHVSRNDSGVEFDTGNERLMFTNSGITENSLDPFGFEDDDFETSKWDSLSGSVDRSLSSSGKAALGGYIDTSDFIPASQQESNNVEYYNSQETSCSSAADEDKSNLLADCLLTAIKVLMNLCNDNQEGCQQIASSGGLEILPSLIAGHFPSFSLPSPHARDGSLSSKSSLTVHERSNTPLTDQKLDFLVAILGLLVNLVEKDVNNRSQLAAASISLPNLVGPNSKGQSNLIPILCSIFLANQGTTEMDGEEKNFSWEDEDAILQGEKEAEKMIIEAYAALLLAFLSTERKARRAIAERLPGRSLKILVPVLERFVEFHLSLNVISPETHSAVLEVIESCRIP